MTMITHEDKIIINNLYNKYDVQMGMSDTSFFKLMKEYTELMED